MTAAKSLETRKAELSAARAVVLNIYRPLLAAWQDNLTANELDRLTAQAFELSRAPLRRYHRLRRIVEIMQWAKDHPQETETETKEKE
jgi:hypothetical protein